ncbi:MAG: sugar phosphate isomerase/epimerase family protein [Chloroflexota bacterium]
MQLLYFCPRWGSLDLPIEAFAAKVRQAGYDGVEMSLPLDDPAQRARILQALEGQGLQLIAQHWETVNPDPAAHLDEYCRRLENLADARPLLINSQTGRDWFPYEHNRCMIDAAQEIAARRGVKILHETHRGKFSFCAASTVRFLEADPALRIAADFSHWCVVSESLLEDQQPALALAISRADHIHARVGHAEGPQTPDPRAPEWAAALAAHLDWWDRIIEQRRREGAARFTITTEFGPTPYLPALPYTRMPVADQWEINVHMLDLLHRRYA